MSHLEEDLDDEADASRLERYLRERRRARSLPAALLGCSEAGKRVKFADSMGLDLASVKHFSALEEPRVPTKVLSRHRSFPPPPPPQDARGHRLLCCFPELADAERRVRQLGVCLEKVSVSRSDVRGHIRVLSEAGPREVGVRYTFNDWLSHVDAQALPLAEAPGSVGQRFGFTVYTPPVLEAGSAVHLAVYLRGERGERWDNNAGRNYTLRYCGPPPEALGFGGGAFHGT